MAQFAEEHRLRAAQSMVAGDQFPACIACSESRHPLPHRDPPACPRIAVHIYTYSNRYLYLL